MSSEFESAAQRRERLSALVDGELDTPALSSACECWQADEELRRDWHAWHLIGDVLRSDDLACAAERDLRLLGAVRERLSGEPVVLAPAALRHAVAAGRFDFRGGHWRVPGAIAAGFALVIGTVVVMRPADSGAGNPAQLAAATERADGSAVETISASAGGDARVAQAGPSVIRLDPQGRLVQTPALDRQMIRDARLDRYLAAHKQFAGSSALGVPSAFLSGATVDASSR